MSLNALQDDLNAEFDLPAPIDGPQIWYGPAMSASDEWMHAVSETDLAEIDVAMRLLVDDDRDITQIGKADFELPTLAPKLAAIREEVIAGRGFALIRGLPVDSWSMREAATVYYGIGTHFGNARSQNGKGHVLGHVRDLGRDAVNDQTARIYQTRERQTFHTDSCDIVALLCLKTARSGGASTLVSSMTIYNEMHKRRPDLLRLMFEPFATDRRGEVPAGKKPLFEIPVYNFHAGFLSAIYARRYIESAQRFDEVLELTVEQREALDLFDSLANDLEINLEMDFQPGDMQLVHNHTILHDRTAYDDWEDPEKKRHLLRLWLAVPSARPLPEIYAERYGRVTVGDRGGIIVPGSRLNAPLEAE